MNFTHIHAFIHSFIPYALLAAGLILVVSLFPPKGLDGTQRAPTAVWQTTINTEGDTAPRLSPTGQPNQVCSAWLQDWSDPAKHEGQLEWILGFVTGSNYRSEGQGQPEDTDEVEVFIEHYCRNNPEHQLFMAAAALVQESGGPAALHDFKKEGDGGLPTSRRLGVRSGLTGSLICDVCAPISSTNEHLAREQNRMDPVSRSTTICWITSGLNTASETWEGEGRDDVKRAASTVDRGITPGRDDHSQQEAKCYQGARDKPAWDQVFGHAREPVSESEVPISYYTRSNIARQTGT